MLLTEPSTLQYKRGIGGGITSTQINNYTAPDKNIAARYFYTLIIQGKAHRFEITKNRCLKIYENFLAHPRTVFQTAWNTNLYSKFRLKFLHLF